MAYLLGTGVEPVLTSDTGHLCNASVYKAVQLHSSQYQQLLGVFEVRHNRLTCAVAILAQANLAQG